MLARGQATYLRSERPGAATVIVVEFFLDEIISSLKIKPLSISRSRTNSGYSRPQEAKFLF